MIPYLLATVGGFLIGDSMKSESFADGGVMWRVEPTTLEEDMKEAKELIGEEKWASMSMQEQKDLTEYLKSQGRIGLPGQEEDIETISALQYYAKGGNIYRTSTGEIINWNPKKFRIVKEDEKYKTSWGRLGDAVGEFDIKDSGKWWYGTLYELDDFDKDYWKGIKLKPDEKLYRYETPTTKIGNMRPIVKINIDKGLIYFLKDLYSDKPNFDRKGIKLKFLQLHENQL